jgi:hypothetical protein
MPSRLQQLLLPYAEYFKQKGFDWTQPHQDCPSYQCLAKLLLAEDTPQELQDDLSLIDDMATIEAMDLLLDFAAQQGIRHDLGPVETPEDVATYFCLHHRSLLQMVHNERACGRVRSFVFFRTDKTAPTFTLPSLEVLQPLEEELGTWYAQRGRGQGSRILACRRRDGYWFLVRHGDTFRRDDCWVTGQVYYRPAKDDLLVYDAKLGELRINARTVLERLRYRQLFGKYLFGDENFFPGTEKYTLQPLLEDGRRALDVSGIDGLEWVRLSRLDYHGSRNCQGVTSHRSKDVFAYLERYSLNLQDHQRLVQASFYVKFVGVSQPRSVTIYPSNLALYTRNDYAGIIEEWLLARGFILPEENHYDRYTTFLDRPRANVRLGNCAS